MNMTDAEIAVAGATHIAGVNYSHPSLALLAAILRAERKDDEHR